MSYNFTNLDISIDETISCEWQPTIGWSEFLSKQTPQHMTCACNKYNACIYIQKPNNNILFS
jgi:hypothetical protein